MLFDHPYSSFLEQLEKPGRYVGGEYASAPAPPEDFAGLRVALSYPDVYEIGMSHIGLSVLYQVVNEKTPHHAERVFMPWPDLEERLTALDLPLVSLESARPLADFDVVGFSLQYELTYTNILAMLQLGRIPLRAAHRDEEHPLVVVGGPLAVHLEPLAPFVDLAVVGDGEEALPELLDVLERASREGKGRRETIDGAARLPFVYAPFVLDRCVDEASGREVIASGPGSVARRANVKSLDEHPTGAGPVPHVEAVFDRYSVEIARGCSSGCRFCQAGYLYRPVRERSEQEVDDAVERAVGCFGFDEISLASLSTADHSRITSIIASLGEKLTPRRVSLSVPSLRAYGLADELVEVLARLRRSGVTMAPEAGSQRLRDVINKNVTEDDLLAASARFFDWGFRRIKLYFMLGLPTETDEDLGAMVELADALRTLGRRRMNGRTPTIVSSVSTFVPKPFTPLERDAMISLEEIKRRQALIRDRARSKRLEFKFHDPASSILEAVLCRGDVRLAGTLEAAFEKGARFDGWDEMMRRDIWDDALAGVDVDRYLGAVPDSARLPWDHIKAGVTPGFLSKERRRAAEGRLTPPCGVFEGEDGAEDFVCHACGSACQAAALSKRPRRLVEKYEERPGRTARGKPRPRVLETAEGARVERIRLCWSKWGRAGLVGHLDTMRHLTRSLRRAGLEIAYTQGFHPKPRLVSSPPLPLGTIGLEEVTDVFLVEPPTSEEISRRLSEALPPDFALVSVRPVAPGEPALSKSVRAARYIACLPEAGPNPQEAALALESLLKREEVLVEKERKGRRKVVDIRPWLISARVLEEPRAKIKIPDSENMVQIELDIEIPGSGGVKPKEIIEAVFPDGTGQNVILVRTKIHLDPIT